MAVTAALVAHLLLGDVGELLAVDGGHLLYLLVDLIRVGRLIHGTPRTSRMIRMLRTCICYVRCIRHIRVVRLRHGTWDVTGGDTAMPRGATRGLSTSQCSFAVTP